MLHKEVEHVAILRCFHDRLAKLEMLLSSQQVEIAAFVKAHKGFANNADEIFLFVGFLRCLPFAFDVPLFQPGNKFLAANTTAAAEGWATCSF